MRKELVFGYHAVLAILQHAPQSVQELYLQQGRQDQRVQNILQEAKQHDLSAMILPRQKLDVMVNGARHQGIVAVIAKSVKYESEGDLATFLSDLQPPSLILILDGVQDPHNLGACLRTANAAGVNAVIVPKDNAVGITDVVRKVASGAAEAVNFFQVVNLARELDRLKQAGVWIYGADQDAAHTIYQADLTGSVAIVLGAEGRGLRRLTKEKCDALMSIPMFGSVASLNVSAAAAVCLFEAVRCQSLAKNPSYDGEG